ncbi:MAG: hypothetical protein CSA58_11410 [Micrococcales bacterium]|nr:MAG: hypothetical protein CSB46_02920 [Micrococcales bacterium]PIE26060.1 MAG: hypothetical protein CSA58_11410 [Micrococcales bacterium]
MRIKTMTLGAVGLVAAAGFALAVPDLAHATNPPAASSTVSAAEDSSDPKHSAAAERIKTDLRGLVENGGITDEQATAVADTLAERAGQRMDRPGGPGGRHGPRGQHGVIGGTGLDAVAAVLGLGTDELRDELGGRTLGEIADEAGVSRGDVVRAIVDAQAERISERVTEGDLTQDRADDIIAELEHRAEDMLDRPGGERPAGGHDGMRAGPESSPGAWAAGPGTATPETSPATS